ncbi:helix-turn-helix domain-containing protein [Leifsonia aquatica]|uniref:helix-turn-helix domain-containing protein n=1 Tax=Leifsonia aquatica TaxID=144185 RepID=UPI00382C000E
MSRNTHPEPEIALATAALRAVQHGLSAHVDEPVLQLAVQGEETVPVPREAVELLARILGSMAAGRGVTIMPANAELTTAQAAEILNVSRPHVIKLLDEGKIDFRMVGTHRRIRADSLRDFQRTDGLRRRDAFAELVALSQDSGEKE